MDSWSPVKVAAAQVGSVLFDVSSTMRKVDHMCREAADSDVQLLVFPEALLGGYPKGADFGTKVAAAAIPVAICSGDTGMPPSLVRGLKRNN